MMQRRGRLVWLCAAAIAFMTGRSPAAPPAAVAVFDDPCFPYFTSGAALYPRDVVSYLCKHGLDTRLLSADELADEEVFNARRFAVYVHLFGNTFPLDAYENLRRFHAAGGSMVLTGVPFCHPCRQVGAKDWTLYSHRDRDEAGREKESPHGGQWCYRLRKNSENWSGIGSCRLRAMPGEGFIVSAWVKTQGRIGLPDDHGRVFLRFWDAGGKFLGQDGPDFPVNCSTWSRVEKPLTAPAGTTEVDVLPAFWGSPGTLWIDDISLVRAGGSPQSNLLANPGFEQGGGEWVDLGHDSAWFSHERMGTGGFHTPPRERLNWQAGSPRVLGLPLSELLRSAADWSQTLDPVTLPPQDHIVRLVEGSSENQRWPALAAIHHGCPQFQGAIDFWAGTQLWGGSLDATLAQREVLLRATLYVLEHKGLTSSSKAAIIRARSAREYRSSVPPGDLPVPHIGPQQSVFPKCPTPAHELTVVDVRTAPLDMRLAIASLQGIVNRKQPRLYLIADAVYTNPQTDERWLNWMQTRGDIKSVRRPSTPGEALQIFREEVSGCVVTDPAISASVNVASMLASVKKAILASPEMANRLKWSVVMDLRGKWKTNAEAYEWAFRYLWPRLNHRVLASIAPEWIGPRDYAISTNAFTYWITGRIDGATRGGASLEERKVIGELLQAMPPGCGVVGAPYNGEGVGIQEGPGVEMWSRYAKFLSWSGEVNNLSVYSGTQPPTFRSPQPRTLTLDASKVYCCFLISDGDAPINWYRFFPAAYWDDANRGAFPLTWSVGPTVYDLMPNIMDYYYRKATENDAFVCAVSGVGYCFGDVYGRQYAQPDRLFDAFLDVTHQYCQHMDLCAVWTHSTTGTRLRSVAERVPGLVCLLPDYGLQAGVDYERANEMVSGLPVFRALTTFDPKVWGDQVIENMLSDIRHATPEHRPAFMHVFVQCYPWTPTMLRTLLDRLGPGYVPVLPQQLAELFRHSTHMTAAKPGQTGEGG